MEYGNLFNIVKALPLAVVLTLGLSPPGVASAQETTIVSVSAPSQVNSGEQFTVDILVQPGEAIAGVQFDLAFDQSLVTADGVAEGSLLSQGGAATYFNPGGIDNAAGTINGVAGAIITPGQAASTAGVFATITLTAGTGGGTCPLTLSDVVVGNINGHAVPVAVVNGQVTVGGQDTINQPPQLSLIGGKSGVEGELLEFTISATDPDGDTLTYTASNLPSGAAFYAETGTFSWTPGSGQAGSYPDVHFEVSDGELTDSENITITVNTPASSGGGGGGGGGSSSSSNSPPVLDTIGDKPVGEGELLEFTISATDPDGDALTYTASNLPPRASFDPETQTFSWTPSPGQAGTYLGVHFEAFDGKATSSEEITITVLENNRPVLDAIGDKSGVEGELLAFTISATDPDGDALTYSASSLPPGASFNPETQTFSWTPSPGQAGTYPNLHFEVFDGVSTDSEDVTIAVHTPDTTPPEIAEVTASETTSDSVEIRWTTDEPGTSQVKYWASPSKVTPLNETLVTHHLVRITDLTPGTDYNYRSLSRDEKGNLAASPVHTFNTPVISASFTTGALDITPTVADIGEEITISVLVTNSGNTTGSYEVTLRIDGSTEATERVIDLADGSSQTVTFTTTREIVGVHAVDVDGITGSLVVREATDSGTDITPFSVTPIYDMETGVLLFARIDYEVSESYESVLFSELGAELTLRVSLDGEILEEVSLLSSSEPAPSTNPGSLDYVPLQGWSIGTYTFQAELSASEGVVETSPVEPLKVPAEAIVKVVSWAILGLIIGAMMTVAAVTVIAILHRRRDMLRA